MATINTSSTLLLTWLLLIHPQKLCDAFGGINVSSKIPREGIVGNRCHRSRRLRLRSIDNEEVEGQTIKIPILHETDRLLVIDKPPGISHHNGEYDGKLGIISLICQQQNCRLYGVHRLDRVTSGVLVLAKDQEMAAELSQAFREKKVDKFYLGISSKKPKMKKQGWVKGHMERSRNKSWILTRSTPNSDNNLDTNKSSSDIEKQTIKPTMAVTRLFTASLNSLENDVVYDEDGSDKTTPIPKTCILFRPYTGKTHQLRVAAKSIGLALLGDPIYSDGTSSQSLHQRTYLHSAAIHVTLTDGPLTVWSPPPFDGLWSIAEENENSPFQEIVKNLMEKHCDVVPVLETMKSKIQP